MKIFLYIKIGSSIVVMQVDIGSMWTTIRDKILTHMGGYGRFLRLRHGCYICRLSDLLIRFSMSLVCIVIW